MGRLHPNRHFLDIQLANGHVPAHSRALSSVAPLSLTSREDSTRAQLQKQRLTEQQHAVIVSQKIPGLKTSAAFFASLRTNLRLNASPPPSPISTPQSMRGSVSPLPPPSPLSIPMESGMDQTESTPAEDPMAGVPELKSYVTDNDEEKVAAIKLVADSVAQMRQGANQALIFHPLNMAVAVAVASLIARTLINRKHDVITVATTCSGLFMVCLALCRYATQGYIVAAEAIDWGWLGDADVIVTKFGDELIGTVIIDWISSESRQRRKKSWKGEIKGWAVRLKYRGKGVGAALLEDAVREFRSRGAETIEYADEHANSKRVLPRFYNGQFDKREKRARDLLQDLLEASPARGKRKGGGST